jgi:hypothetical protein
MARLQNGIMGTVRGKIGPVETINGRYGNYVRPRRQKSKISPTKAKRMTIDRFGMMMHWLSRARHFATIGFAENAATHSAYNAAKSYNMRNGVKATDDGYVLDYPHIMLSRGSLRQVDDAAVTVNNGSLLCTWTDNSHPGWADATDKAMIYVYNSTKDSSVTDLNAAVRKDGRAVIPIPDFWKGETIHIYLAFASADGTHSADSQYLGEILLLRL